MSYFTIDDSLERLKNISSIGSSLVIAILTTFLVYYNFSQMSELKFTGFFINPVINEKGEVKSIAEEDFLEDRTYQVRTDVYSIKFPTYIKKVRCKEKPLFLIIGNKITNLGLIKANINEIRYYMTYPKHDRPFVIEKEISLAHEETEPIILNFPVDTKIWNYTLKGGTTVLKFEAIGTTGKY